MSNVTAQLDLLQMETNPSSTNFPARSKKLPPPPLCLPATITPMDEQKIVKSNQQHEQKKSLNNCCLSSSAEDCPHSSVVYTLPASQRPHIHETLMASSSVLLVPPSSEIKHKKSSTNQINLVKQRQSSSKVTITDAEWIDFMRLIIHKPLENELKLLLDKYKMTYFDRVNAPNTIDDTIRSSLCTIVSDALATYSNSAILSSTAADDLSTNVSSLVLPSSTTNNIDSKRKRKNIDASLSLSVPVNINSQTKFVVSYIIPGKYDNNNNGNQTAINQQQQQKQFQRKYSHLFKYIPDKDELIYLTHEGRLKSISTSSTHNNNICLMLYDEVAPNMDDYDLELSGILIDDSFTLSESILTHIYSSIH